MAFRLRLLLLALALTACTPGLARPDDFLLDRLHFGRNAAGQLVVSDSAWAQFLAEEVTPRFPEGFTVLAANGQWRGVDGTIEREGTFVLEVLHPATPVADSLLTVVIESYKRRFHQESVLRMTAPVRARF